MPLQDAVPAFGRWMTIILSAIHVDPLLSVRITGAHTIYLEYLVLTSKQLQLYYLALGGLWQGATVVMLYLHPQLSRIPRKKI